MTDIPKFPYEHLVSSLTSTYFNKNCYSKVSNAICNEKGVKNFLEAQNGQVLEMVTDIFFIVPSFPTLI